MRQPFFLQFLFLSSFISFLIQLLMRVHRERIKIAFGLWIPILVLRIVVAETEAWPQALGLSALGLASIVSDIFSLKLLNWRHDKRNWLFIFKGNMINVTITIVWASFVTLFCASWNLEILRYFLIFHHLVPLGIEDILRLCKLDNKFYNFFEGRMTVTFQAVKNIIRLFLVNI